MTTSTIQRGTCPECGQQVPLYRGKLRSHQLRATAMHPASTCPGGTHEPGEHRQAGQLILGDFAAAG